MKTESDNTPQNKEITRDDFDFLLLIGKGGFSKVWKVRYKLTNEIFALKEISKLKILDKNIRKNIFFELNILSKLKHPFLLNLHFAFQDLDNLYIVTDYFGGGDLGYHIYQNKIFTESQTKFLIACIIHGLSYIHKNNIIHRDLKINNLVFDSKGYLHIIDFGISKENDRNNYLNTHCTYLYTAPEILLKKNYSFSSDFYSIGVIALLLMRRVFPYNGTKDEIREKMKKTKIHIKEKIGWDIKSKFFIKGLLEINPEKRLGNKNGIKELKEHPWFQNFSWEELKNKTMPAPFIPKENAQNFDKEYLNKEKVIGINTDARYQEILQNENYQIAFDGFYFNKYYRNKGPIIPKNLDLNNKKENKKEDSKGKEQDTMIKVNKPNIKIICEEIESPKPIIVEKKLKPIKFDETEHSSNIVKKRSSNSTKCTKIRINYDYVKLYEKFKNK